MDSETPQEYREQYQSRFGLRAPLWSRATPITLNSETTAWEIYNNRATLLDREMIKDWTDNLNTLLIFAALYSAVLTAFIIESMKLLEEDTGDSMKDILLFISMQLANQTLPAYHPRDFAPPQFATRVNCFFFVSISCSLSAALGAVLALQWVGSYDAGLNNSSPKERAMQRHFRYKGIKDWKMPEVIASLPLLIFVALFLFFVGLADWLWNINKTVAAVVMGGAGFAALFYVITTLVCVLSVAAPFRTPVTKSLPQLFSFCLEILLAPTSFISSKASKIYSKFSKSVKEAPKGKEMRTRREGEAEKKAIGRFGRQEEQYIQKISTLPLESLVWVTQSIDILPHTLNSFITLLESFVELPASQLTTTYLAEVPWLAIFDLLCSPYYGRTNTEAYKPEEIEQVKLLVRCLALLGHPSSPTPHRKLFQFLKSLETPVFSGDLSELYNSHALWRYCPIDLNPESFPHPDENSSNSIPSHYLNKALCRMAATMEFQPSPLTENAYKLFLHHAHEAQKQGYIIVPGTIQKLTKSCYALGEKAKQVTLMPLDCFNIMLKLIVSSVDPSILQGRDSIIEYSIACQTTGRSYPVGDLLNTWIPQWHVGVQGYALARAFRLALQKDRKVQDIQNHLDIALRIVKIPVIPLDGFPLLKEIIFTFSTSDYDFWAPHIRTKMAQIIAFCFPNRFNFDGIHWDQWFIQLFIGLDQMLQDSTWSSDSLEEDRDIFVGFMLHLCGYFQEPNNYLLQKISKNDRDRLFALVDPCLALLASSMLGSGCMLPKALNPTPDLWGKAIWVDVVLHWFKTIAESVTLAGLTFMQNALFSSQTDIHSTIIRTILPHLLVEGRPPSSTEWQGLITRQTLLEILNNRDIQTPKYRILDKISGFGWFTEQFIVVGGEKWLANGYHGVTYADDWEMTFICNAAAAANNHSDLDFWLRSARRLWYRKNRYFNTTYEEQAATLRGIIQLQEMELLEYNSTGDANRQSREITSKRYKYLADWSLEQWYDWKVIVEQVISDMEGASRRPGVSSSALPQQPFRIECIVSRTTDPDFI